MKYLNIKLFRDIKNSWTQFFSVFLMAFLSILVFLGLQGAWKGLEVSLDNYLSTSNLADYWVQVSQVTDNDLDEIKTIESVSTIQVKTSIRAASGEDTISLETVSSDLSLPNVQEGKELDFSAPGSILLDINYAEEHTLEVGDSITLTYLDKEKSFNIVGLVQSPDKIYFTGSQEFIAPNHSDYGYAYLSDDGMEDFIGSSNANVVELQGSGEDIRDEVEAIFGSRLLTYYNKETLTGVSTAIERVGQIKNLSYLFSFIFVLLAILAMYTTIRRIITSQTMELAVLKAIGVSQNSLAFHYTSYGFLISIIGVLSGAICSPLISLFVLETQKAMFDLPDWTLAYEWSSVLVAFIVVSICSSTAYLASRKVIKGLPAKYLNGSDEKGGRPIFLEKLSSIWKLISYSERWSLRDAFLNRSRILMGVIGVAGGMMLMIAGIGMPQSMNHLVDQAYHTDFTYNRRFTVVNPIDFELDSNSQLVQINQAHFTPDDGYNRLLIVLADGDYVDMKTIDGNKIEEGGLYLTQDFAERANLKEGDNVAVRVYPSKEAINLPVKGIVVSETNQGAYVLQETWEEAGGTFNSTTVLVNHQVEETDDVISTIAIKDQEKNAREFVYSLTSIFLMIIGFAAMLIVVVLYNLGSLSFIEKSRDFATLRVLGFFKRDLVRLTFVENLLTTFIGWLVGVPLGIWFLEQYVSTFSTITLDYTSYVNVATIGLSSVFVWLCSLTTTFFVSRRLEQLDMVQALKGVE